MDANESSSKRVFATLLTVITGPFRLITDPLFKGISGMDTSTVIAKAFGLNIMKCKHCNLFFSSISSSCKKSPTGKHRE
jgi:hypothetical protein